MDLDPDALGPRLRLGAALAQSPSTAAEAITLLNSVLEREPQHPLAHGSIALAHAQLGETSEAERHLTRALRLGHYDPELERRVRGAGAPPP
jgi:Tfp pilus assembly protein PilF